MMTRHLYPLHCLFPPAKAPMLYPCHPNTLPLSPIHLLPLQYHVRFQFVVFSHAVIFYSCDELSLGNIHLKPNNFSNSLWLSNYCLIRDQYHHLCNLVRFSLCLSLTHCPLTYFVLPSFLIIHFSFNSFPAAVATAASYEEILYQVSRGVILIQQFKI